MRKIFRWAIVAQVVGLAFLTASAQLPNCPLRPNAGTTVLDSPSLYSQNGTLQLALTLRNAADSAGYMHYCFDYATSNGNIEAPTLRLNPGDTLTLDLTNQLNVTANPAYVKNASMKNMEHMTGAASTDPCHGVMTVNSTNVHFHGLNVPPVCHQDEVVHTLIAPGTTPFRYQIQIPANEPPGLYWYHPHPHGLTALQVNGGATGAIVVGGIEKIKPQVAGLMERVLVLRQQFLNLGSWIPGSFQLTLNFQPAIYPQAASPIIQMKPGEKQFWRFANSSTQAFLALQVRFGNTPQTLELISLDGVPVTGDPMMTTIDVAPAGRAEFIVQGPPTGTTGTFVTAGFDTGPVGNANGFQVLADIVPTTGAFQQMASVIPAAPAPAVTQRFSGLAAMKPTKQRKLFFSEAALGTNPPVNFFITVEGQQPKLFKANERPAIFTKVGAVEDWTVENRTSEEHAFHMHQIHFLVTAIDGVAVANPTMQDTVNIPFWSGKGPFHSVTLRMDFRDPNIAGTFVYHCHVLFHEDNGMMAKVRVDPN
jgi:FtsP/CotA-like multicopper oxidase with cupredoxin domain